MPESALPLNEWSPGKKQVFRFFFIFLLFYILINPNDVIPYFSLVQKLFRQPCYSLVAWLSDVFLRIDIPAMDRYHTATDTTLNYLVVLFTVCVACIGSVIWMFIDKKSANYDKLNAVLVLILRYYLGITWIAYGTLKLIHLQFPELTPITLFHTYGDSLPRELAWSFMGYSTGFNYFMGIAEYILGISLFFRRTYTLGNLIAIGALVNILAFNYFFDDNVKLLSTMLMIMSLFLLSKDARRLSTFFFFGKIATLEEVSSRQLKTGLGNNALLVLKYALIICLIFFDIRSFSIKKKQFGYGVDKPPLYGVYDVKTFIVNKDTLKPLTTDTTRWEKLIVSSIPGKAGIMLMNNNIRYFVFKPDTLNKTIQLIAEKDTSNRYTFTYSLKDSVLSLKGRCRKDTLQIQVQQFDLSKLPLVNHKFHWIIDHQNRLKR
ncbi:MAG TPA: hypothetical protein VK671_11680 [Mucilaginibacter sp.]|nr:hypothetical protein [Mucilaginibacter sp.]